MNRKQALSLLALIADLYSVINTPEPEAAAPVRSNGRGKVRDTETVATAE